MNIKITKENYRQLTWDENIPIDDSYDFYQTLDFDERVEYLKFTLENFPDYDEEWVEYYFDISEKWRTEGAWNQLIEFSEFVRTKSANNYKKNFHYIHEESVLFALFHNDMENVKIRFAENMVQPEKAIDLSLPSIFNVLSIDAANHEYTKEVTEKIWKPLAESHKLIGGAEFNYSAYLYCTFLQELFDDISKGKAVDWDSFQQKVESINFRFIEELKLLPNINFDFDESEFHKNKAYREKHLSRILIDLLYEAHINLGISVYWTYRSWINLNKHIFNSEVATDRSNWFSFTPEMLDRMAGKLYGMLGGNKEEMTITVWVLPYIYDFLLSKGLIDKPTFERMMTYYQFTRRELLKVGRNYLWIYKGLFSWKKPSFISNEEWENEKNIFSSTIHLSRKEAADAINEYFSQLPELPKEAIPKPPPPSPIERIMEKRNNEKREENKKTNVKNKSRATARKKRKKKPKRRKKRKK